MPKHSPLAYLLTREPAAHGESSNSQASLSQSPGVSLFALLSELGRSDVPHSSDDLLALLPMTRCRKYLLRLPGSPGPTTESPAQIPCPPEGGIGPNLGCQHSPSQISAGQEPGSEPSSSDFRHCSQSGWLGQAAGYANCSVDSGPCLHICKLGAY